jgi:hypothetical protein
MPPVGKRFRLSENVINISCPNQKYGIEIPIKDSKDITASAKPLLYAAIVPRVIPIKDAMNIAVNMRRNVAGILLNIKVETGSALKYE